MTNHTKTECPLHPVRQMQNHGKQIKIEANILDAYVKLEANIIDTYVKLRQTRAKINNCIGWSYDPPSITLSFSSIFNLFLVLKKVKIRKN